MKKLGLLNNQGLDSESHPKTTKSKKLSSKTKSPWSFTIYSYDGNCVSVHTNSNIVKTGSRELIEEK